MGISGQQTAGEVKRLRDLVSKDAK
jgi:hypothetical protein